MSERDRQAETANTINVLLPFSFLLFVLFMVNRTNNFLEFNVNCDPLRMYGVVMCAYICIEIIMFNICVHMKEEKKTKTIALNTHMGCTIRIHTHPHSYLFLFIDN